MLSIECGGNRNFTGLATVGLRSRAYMVPTKSLLNVTRTVACDHNPWFVATVRALVELVQLNLSSNQFLLENILYLKPATFKVTGKIENTNLAN